CLSRATKCTAVPRLLRASSCTAAVTTPSLRGTTCTTTATPGWRCLSRSTPMCPRTRSRTTSTACGSAWAVPTTSSPTTPSATT
ncbi:unnamed protein product, partial [Ectocarpus sp. 8 AP-2014]